MADEKYDGSPARVRRGPEVPLELSTQIEQLVTVALSTLQGMWRYRWSALTLAWGTCLVGWAVVYLMPDVYSANARFYVDTESMVRRVVKDLTVSADMMSEINVLTRVMLSRPQLEKTARLADMDLDVSTPQQHEAMIERLAQSIHITREGAESVFRISYEDSDRNRAETVVKTVLDTFVEDALGERRTDSGAATEFLDTQIGEYERRLDEADERLAEFKRQNIGLMPGETGDYYTRLQKGMADIEETRAALKLAEETRSEYARQLEGEEPVFGVLSGRAATNEGARPVGSNDALIARYEAEMQTLLLKYTPGHPDVRALQETIDRLRSQQTTSSAPTLTAPAPTPRHAPVLPGDTLDVNLVYQRMRMGLSEAEVSIATLSSKLATQEADVKELQARVDTIPEIERQLSALNRDYDVTRTQYENLLKRREQLYITGEVEQSGDQLQFRPIEPPRALLKPVGPNRPLLLSGATVFAIGLALAFGFLLHQLNPVFNNRRDLRDATGLPVLGAISFAEGADVRALAKRRDRMFAAACGVLPVALVLAMVAEDTVRRLIGAAFDGMPL